jgi:hypothetical protein
MTRLRTTALIIVLFGCGGALFSQGPKTQDSGHTHIISLIRLLANPNDFDGQRINTLGFLTFGEGADWTVSLYVSESDGHNGIYTNSIEVLIDKSAVEGKNVMGKYVSLTATYHAPTPRKGWPYVDHVEVKPWPFAQASPK